MSYLCSPSKTLTDEEVVEVYGLYKQATVGDVDIEKPAETDVKVSDILQYLATS